MKKQRRTSRQSASKKPRAKKENIKSSRPRTWKEAKPTGVINRPRVLKSSYGAKRAMELLVKTIKEAGKPVPSIDATMKDPSTSFILDMYQTIANLTDKQLAAFISECAAEEPTDFRLPTLIGQAKRIFHDMFDVDLTDTKIAKPMWKMWPNTRHKPRDGETEMTTKKVAKKAASKAKKTPTKLSAAAAKKAAAKKPPFDGATKKKASKKAAAPAKKGSIASTATVVAVKGMKSPVLQIRRELVESIPARGTTVAKLLETYAQGHIDACLKKGFIKEK